MESALASQDSRLNHSCSPNCQQSWDEDSRRLDRDEWNDFCRLKRCSVWLWEIRSMCMRSRKALCHDKDSTRTRALWLGEKWPQICRSCQQRLYAICTGNSDEFLGWNEDRNQCCDLVSTWFMHRLTMVFAALRLIAIRGLALFEAGYCVLQTKLL